MTSGEKITFRVGSQADIADITAPPVYRRPHVPAVGPEPERCGQPHPGEEGSVQRDLVLACPELVPGELEAGLLDQHPGQVRRDERHRLASQAGALAVA